MKKIICVLFFVMMQFLSPVKASGSFNITQEMWTQLMKTMQSINGSVNINHELLLQINDTVNTINATTTYIAAYGTKTFSKITSETIAGITGLTNEQTVTLALCIWFGLYTAPIAKQFLVDPMLTKAFEWYVFWVDWARNIYPSDTRRYIREDATLSKRSTKILCWLCDALNNEVDGHYKKNELFKRGFTSDEGSRIFDYTFPRFTIRLIPSLNRHHALEDAPLLKSLSEETKTKWIELISPHLTPHMGDTRYRVFLEAIVKEIKRGRIREYDLPDEDGFDRMNRNDSLMRMGLSFGTLPEPENDDVSWWQRMGQCCGLCASPPTPFDQEPLPAHLPKFTPHFNIELVEYELPIQKGSVQNVVIPLRHHDSSRDRELDDVA